MNTQAAQRRADAERTGMVLIPAGAFTMGSSGFGEFEGPTHEVNVSAFFAPV